LNYRHQLACRHTCSHQHRVVCIPSPVTIADDHLRLFARRNKALWLLLGVPLLACGSPQEAIKVDVPVMIDATEIKVVTTDLRYDVELFEARMMVKDFTFAIA